MMDVAVITPTIKGRENLLERAQNSITVETVSYIHGYAVDVDGDGPAAVRNQLVKESPASRYIAFLDDDDVFKPGHLTKLVRHADTTGADVVYPWFDLMKGGYLRNDLKILKINGQDAFEQPFNADALRHNNYIPVTALVRRDKFQEVGGFPRPNTEEWPHKDCEDWALWLRLLNIGAKFSHLPERTWTWVHHSKNTSGRPENARRIYGERA